LGKPVALIPIGIYIEEENFVIYLVLLLYGILATGALSGFSLVSIAVP
jgi:hypothetical protein